MGDRLGKVLFWTCCILAVAWLAFALLVMSINPLPAINSQHIIAIIVAAVIISAVGRVARYVLAGR